MMIDNEVSFTSLCYITVDYEGRIWLNRLADVEDDILHTPFKSERTDNYFENRDRLYRNDGPTALGTVGIWEWTAIPNRDNPAIDYVQSYYHQCLVCRSSRLKAISKNCWRIANGNK